MSLCTEWTLRKYLPEERQAKPLYCRSWECPICAPRRQKQLVAQALAGEPTRFLTLTVSPETGETPEDCHRVLMHAWDVFVKRVRRRFAGKPFEYLWTVEATKRGQPHLHVLLRCDFLPKAWISACFAELARAPIVDIELIDSVNKAAAYVAKYVAKKPARFGNSKRYFASRGYELDKSRKPLPKSENPFRWELHPFPIAQVIREWSLAGLIQLVDGANIVKFVSATWRPP